MTRPLSVFYGSDESKEGQGEDEEQGRKGGVSQCHFREQVALSFGTALSGQILNS
jgi:hypothetical protein